MLCVSSEVTFRKNLDGSRTQGLGPSSNSISFEEPRVTKATEEGSTAYGKKKEKSQPSSERRMLEALPCRLQVTKDAVPLEVSVSAMLPGVLVQEYSGENSILLSDILLGRSEHKLICLFHKTIQHKP